MSLERSTAAGEEKRHYDLWEKLALEDEDDHELRPYAVYGVDAEVPRDAISFDVPSSEKKGVAPPLCWTRCASFT